jgi:phosphopantothenoylcysteine decarboxylase
VKILLGVTGSVAATMTPKLIKTLSELGHELEIAATASSLYFWTGEEAKASVFLEKDEWPGELYQRGDPVLHIELMKWADVLLIAPLTANTLAKIACGLADNLLTSIARAWPVTKPIILALAMNTNMWNNPVTGENIARLAARYPKLEIIDPVEKELACGDRGIGAMAEIESIVSRVNSVG